MSLHEGVKGPKKRRLGFYWARFEGILLIAEWTAKKAWLVPGSSSDYTDEQFCEIIRGPLKPPTTLAFSGKVTEAKYRD